MVALIALPAVLATRRAASAGKPTPVIRPAAESEPAASEAPVDPSSAKTLATPVPAPQTRTRATTAWELSDSANPSEAAVRIRELLREETDDLVRCEIIGAASTLDATPALRQLFEESAQPTQSSRVRQVALDLWLDVYPDEAPAIARRFLTDPDEDVRGIAEDYFSARKEDAKSASPK